jgi:hypothetical protein
MEKKTRSDAFSEKISEEQNAQLRQWLAAHTYDEVLDLIKAEPPVGFGLEIHKATLSRYFHEHFYEIDQVRQKRIQSTIYDHQRLLDFDDEGGVRNFMHESAALRLQEHLCHFLAQPIESVADLKTLASISKLITQLKVDLSDPDLHLKDIDKLTAALKAQKAWNKAQTEVSREEPKSA